MDEVLARRPDTGLRAPATGFVTRGLASLRRWAENARTRRRLRRELADLADAGMCESVLRPFGLSPFGASRLVQAYPGAMRRYAAMTRRLGLAAKLPAPEGISDMSARHRRCLFCRAAGACEQWLDGKGRFAEPGQFCPNSEAFERARRD